MKTIIASILVSAASVAAAIDPLFPVSGFLYSDGNGNVTSRVNVVPENALVLTNSSIKTQSGGNVTPENLGAVANDQTYQTMASKANSAVQPDTLVQTVSAVKDLHWDPGLQVTWTNIVNNGHIYYVTVTNTNISVAQ